MQIEVVADAPGRPGQREVEAAPWVRVIPPDQGTAEHGLVAQLGAGEAEVIALAVDLGEPVLIVMDDGPARRAARERGFAVVGTAGLLVVAKEAGLLPAVRLVLA